MNIKELYTSHPHFSKITNALNSAGYNKIFLRGLKSSSSSLLLASCFDKLRQNALIIRSDKESAAYCHNDLSRIFGEDKVVLLPSSYKRTMHYDQLDNGGIMMRTEVMKLLNDASKQPIIIVSYPEAIAEKVVSQAQLDDNSLVLSVNEKITTKDLTEHLLEAGFERFDFVYEPGQFAMRGSIIDIYSYGSEHPFRLDFFGDEIETMRTFNAETQSSIGALEKAIIIPDIQSQHSELERINFIEYIPNGTHIWCDDSKFLFERIQHIYDKTVEKNAPIPEGMQIADLLATGNAIQNKMSSFKHIEFGTRSFSESEITFDFNISKQPEFQKNFQLLGENIQNKTENDYKVYILSENANQIDRLNAIFQSEEVNMEVSFESIQTIIHEGFIDKDLKVCLYTDHQIFERFHKFVLKKTSTQKGREAITLKELNDLHPGDYVVHSDHGVGSFAGLTQIDTNGKKQDALIIRYKDGDLIYVSIHSLHRISKFKGKEGTPPKIHKLGSGVWQKITSKARKKVKDIARELINLYAKRKAEKGFEFSQDSFMQQELEASFFYEDTPDQNKATIAFKKDMEASIPMDRLICGDVGFGKTEIAIRAAFKAVADNKQVAVLVPTTILALQHYRTFSERLKDFPCTVDYISRLKTTAKQRETLENLEKGKVDILIGTHRLIGKDVKFKDLGLLIVDEEQKFGVTVKDRLKNIRVNVDTLTLTATPIPRTLQFSLMGARDLSIINTAPPNRYPIETELITFNEDIIREAINYEVDRNGQVFFIHNRVHNIAEVEALIQRLCPRVKTVYAHGQMKGTQLENTMLKFINGDYDVLIATSIIENGLDIPNANTIIINNANNFGLSDLHQLRGRVGRSNKRAFCFLLAPPLSTLSEDARRRLKAIEDFSELGSGFNIALQDLDIRGAGNLLGGEQSGFIADIGFETYHRILNETLLELKENEFREVFEGEQNDQFAVDST